MRIYADTLGKRQEAYKVGGRAYKCFPPSSNTLANAIEFTDIRDAAVFLLQNPDWGIRMNPGSAIKYQDIVIER